MSKTNEQRRDEIEQLIIKKEELSVKQLAKHFGVSLETIRMDFRYLEEKGILYRTHGGATLRSTNIDIPMDIRAKQAIQSKKQIAQEVLNYIKDDMTIYIDPSSTALPLGNLLKLRKNVTVVTNSYDLIGLLKETTHTIFMLGGEFSKQGKRTVGQYTHKMIETMYFDICILGMDGCQNIDGPANQHYDEVALNQHVLKRSKQAILVSDASKFDKIAHYQYANFSQFYALITTPLKPSDKQRLPITTIIEINEGEKE